MAAMLGLALLPSLCGLFRNEGLDMKLEEISVKQINGVSALKEGELHAFGISSVKDLLEYYPFRYEDYRLRSLSEVKDGDKITVQGKIMGIPVLQRYGKSPVSPAR